MKSYTVRQLIENDYGCEGIPEGGEPMVRLQLVSDEGEAIWVSQSDRLMFELGIDEGSIVMYDGSNVTPV